jgi:hypothetical protein
MGLKGVGGRLRRISSDRGRRNPHVIARSRPDDYDHRHDGHGADPRGDALH